MKIDITNRTITASYAELRAANISADVHAVKVYSNGEMYVYTPPMCGDMRAKKEWGHKITDAPKRNIFASVPPGRWEVVKHWPIL